MDENVALDKNLQKKFVKNVKRVKKLIKSPETNTETIKSKSNHSRAVVYIGHIPHGFYEDEMRAYFKQFGKVTNVRVCRSRLTGQSKGYAFIEFLHPDVAEIVAETMNNYVMFNRRLVAKCMPSKPQHKKLFRSSKWSKNNCPSKYLRNKANADRNRHLSDAEQLQKNKQIMSIVNKTLKKLKEMGIDYDFKVSDECIQTLTPTTNDSLSFDKISKTKNTIVSKAKRKKIE